MHGLGMARKKKQTEPRAAYSKEGVDLTLIRRMLSLTPAGRLRVLQSYVRSIQRLRSANRKG